MLTEAQLGRNKNRLLHGIEQRKEIAHRTAKGETLQDIATALSITVRTVKYHVSKMYRENGLYGNADKRQFLTLCLTNSVSQVICTSIDG